MSAKVAGKSYFQPESPEDIESPERLQFVCETAFHCVLQNIGHLLSSLVELKADRTLTLFQGVVGELFKEASEARKQGRSMDPRELPCDRHTDIEQEVNREEE